MDFGIQSCFRFADALRVARWADETGLAAYSHPDHYYAPRLPTEPAHRHDALALLAGLARETRRVELVVMVSPVTFRHPAVLAKTAVTIDHMSGGRFVLGVGTGWLAEEHDLFGVEFPPLAERYARLEDALGYLRAALGKDSPGHDGDFYRLAPMPIEPPPYGELRILVGGTGSHRTPALAGRLADEYNLDLTAPAADLEDRVARMRVAASTAGRQTPKISAFGPAIVAETQRGYDKLVEGEAGYRGITAAELKERSARCSYPHGDRVRVAEQMARLREAGVSRFYLQYFGPWDPDHVASTLDLLRS